MPVRHRWQIILAAQGLCVNCKSKQTFIIKKSSVYREPSSRNVQCGALSEGAGRQQTGGASQKTCGMNLMPSRRYWHVTYIQRREIVSSKTW